MNSGHRHSILPIVAVLFLHMSMAVFSQTRLIDPETARTCGCTLRKWPLLSDFLSKTAPSLASLQPETVLPHYADAGCGDGPILPSSGVYGKVRYSQIASLDLFIDHDWHDFNFFVKLDGDAFYLNSTANLRNNNSFLCYNENNKNCSCIRGESLMEVEWDTKHYPERFWASAGDSVWMVGRYIWDCGHPNGYHTEIHPPRAVALTRLEPYVFSGDKSPSLTNKAYVYIHGRSGMKNYSFKTQEGVESVVFNGYKDAAVAVRDYEFNVPLPPRPPGHQGEPFAQIIELPFGGPSPELSVDPSRQFIRVKYPLKLDDASPDRKFAAVIAAGWRAPVAGIKFRKFIVHVEQIQILKPHNVANLSDWKLWLNANGQWTMLEALPGTDRRMPLNLDRLLNVEGLLGASIPPLKIDKNFYVTVPDTEEARLTIQVSGWVNFYDALFGARDDILNTSLRIPSEMPQVFSRLSTQEGRIGLYFRQFSRSENFGLGDHNRALSDYSGELSRGFEEVDGPARGGFPNGFTETQGDFAIAYTITESP